MAHVRILTPLKASTALMIETVGTDILSFIFSEEERSACSNRRLAGMREECRRHGGYYRGWNIRGTHGNRHPVLFQTTPVFHDPSFLLRETVAEFFIQVLRNKNAATSLSFVVFVAFCSKSLSCR